MTLIRAPFGAAKVVEKAYASSLSVDDGANVLDVNTNLTGALTVNVNMDEQVPDGNELMVKVTDDGSGRQVSWGSNVEGPSKTLSASATAVAHLAKYNGAYYVLSFNEV